MIYKRCPKCRKRIPSGTKCPICAEDRSNRNYKKAEGIAKLYHTNRWRLLRDIVVSKYDGLDAYELSRGNIVPADTVHHIIPAKEDPSLFWSTSNLLPVSRQTHDYIHARYDESAVAKKTMTDILVSLVRHWNM